MVRIPWASGVLLTTAIAVARAGTLESTLSGQALFVLLTGALLAFPVSLVILWLYRRAVMRSMREAGTRQPGSAPAPFSGGAGPPAHHVSITFDAQDRPRSQAAAASVLFAKAVRAPWQTAAVYAVAGLGFALIMGLAQLRSGGAEVLPLRLLFVSWIFAWPVVIAVGLVAARAARPRIVVGSLYFGVLAAVAAAGAATSSEFTILDGVMLWLVLNLAPTVLLLAFLNRRVRAVGPLVLAFMVVATAGMGLGPAVIGNDPDRMRLAVAIGTALRMDPFLALILAGFLIFALVGWLAVLWIRRRYERKQVSDQSITLDALWLFFALLYAVGLMPAGDLWLASGLAAFLAYKIVVRAGFALLTAPQTAVVSPASLLLLRVFSLGRRSEHLFDDMAVRWRHAGPIQMIAGPDLATTAIEPHELLDFTAGKLARRFIDAQPALEQRLAEADDRPDRDGRHRVNEFFCRDDMWRRVLARLIERSDAVLMDVRGFTRANSGVIYELHALVDLVALDCVVFAIDETTDRAFLEETLRKAWAQMSESSPNRGSNEPHVHLISLARDSQSERIALVSSLCAAATVRRALA